jgi:DNA adenine methylase
MVQEMTMKYMGSKNRIAKHILPIMLAERKPNQVWVEPFVGGANMIDKVDGVRIGADKNEYLCALLDALSKGYKPTKVTKEEYRLVKNSKGAYPMKFVGWCGIGCSYSGKWFGGFAGETKTKNGIRDYQQEAINNVLKQAENLKGVEFVCCGYDELEIPTMSLIYCDPPYAGTTKYKDEFDHDKFWQWCRDKANEGHTVFVSEYSAPSDFKCVWEKEFSSSLSANGKIGGNKKSVEKLFTI